MIILNEQDSFHPRVHTFVMATLPGTVAGRAALEIKKAPAVAGA
jgi:hypothetical protein